MRAKSSKPGGTVTVGEGKGIARQWVLRRRYADARVLLRLHGRMDFYEELPRHFEATEEGYYAVHIYVPEEFEIPRIDWDTEMVTASVEIQVTTQILWRESCQ